MNDESKQSSKKANERYLGMWGFGGYDSSAQLNPFDGSEVIKEITTSGIDIHIERGFMSLLGI